MNLRWISAVFLTLALLTAACGGGTTETSESEAPAGGSEAPTEATTGDSSEAAAPADLELVAEGTLTVCTDSPYPPMEFEENGEFTGFDIELMRAIAGNLGLETEVVNSGFDPITSGTALASGQCDIAAASITITEEREQNIDFTDPYFDAEQSLLVKTDSGITDLEGLAGKRIGVQSGTTGKKYAEENAPEDAEIVAFDNPGDIFLAMESGDIEGVLQDLVVNQGRVLEDDSLEVVATYPTDEQYGFAAEEGNTELTGAVNEALQSLRDDGTYDQIFEEWFGGA